MGSIVSVIAYASHASHASHARLASLAPSAPVAPSWLERAQRRLFPFFDGALGWSSEASGSLRQSLRWAADHTGLPMVVVAALGLVLAWRVARRTWYVAFELALALGLLLVATKLGWIRW